MVKEDEVTIARVDPDISGAIMIFDMSYSLINMAKKDLEEKKSASSVEASKNAIRAIASALLLKDGYVASTLESTIGHICYAYPGRFPVAAWRSLEQKTKSTNIFSLIVKKIKKPGEQTGKESLNLAQQFHNSARGVFGV